ncbi:MAG: S9 family peptidase, partial [Erythrobacter sp.]
MKALRQGGTIAASLALLASAPLTADDHTDDQGRLPGLEAPAMTARDLVTMPRLGAPSVARDRYAVYSVTVTDPETLARSSKHYLLDLAVEGAEPVEFDLGISAHGLTFGPDDFLYFLSDEHPDETREQRTRLWRAALEASGNVTGPIPVADIPGTDILGFKLSPAGNGVALWSEVARDCEAFGCDEGDRGTGTGRLYDGDGGFYRHWDRWLRPGVFNRVFVFGMEDGTVVGDPLPLDGEPGGGVTGNTPTMPFGGGEDIAWAPDGSGIYFVVREAGAEEPGSTDLDIWWNDLSGSGPVELTAQNRATDTGPAPSPDGRYLAYLAMACPGYESDRLVVQLRDLSTGETRALTADTDLSFGSLTWSADGSYLLATAADTLDVPTYRIDPETGDVTQLDLIAGNEAHIANLVPLEGDRLLFTRDSIGVPPELYLSNDMGKARPLTDVVTTRMGELASIETTRFRFEGAGGDTVWGQITRLEDQQGPIPAILYVHGGPQG